jgi:hypothetical protein
MDRDFQSQFPEYEDLGHSFDYDRVLLEAYRLISHIFATEKIAGHAASDMDRRFMGPDGKPTNSLEALDQRFFKNEASRLLLFLAITMRNLDERAPFIFDRYVEELCGEVSEETGSVQQLDLREACNKIIHASQYVNFDYEEIEPSFVSPKDKIPLQPTYSLPYLNLKGARPQKKKAVQWVAKVDIIAFTDLVVKCVKVHQAQERAALDR